MLTLHLLREAGHTVCAMFIDYGQIVSAREEHSSRAIAEHFEVSWRRIRVDLGREFGEGETLYRNGLFVFAAAAASPDGSSIAVGIHAGSPYPDCSSNFLNNLEQTLKASSSGFGALVAPLQEWHKPQIIAYAHACDLPLSLTYSCEADPSEPCGRCSSCRDRSGL